MIVAPTAFEIWNSLGGASVLSFIRFLTSAYISSAGPILSKMASSQTCLVVPGLGWLGISFSHSVHVISRWLAWASSLSSQTFLVFPQREHSKKQKWKLSFSQLWLKNRSIVMFTVFYCYGNHRAHPESRGRDKDPDLLKGRVSKNSWPFLIHCVYPLLRFNRC